MNRKLIHAIQISQDRQIEIAAMKYFLSTRGLYYEKRMSGLERTMAEYCGYEEPSDSEIIRLYEQEKMREELLEIKKWDKNDKKD